MYMPPSTPYPSDVAASRTGIGMGSIYLGVCSALGGGDGGRVPLPSSDPKDVEYIHVENKYLVNH